MMSKSFKLDKIDKKIIEILQNNPTTTHTKIAKKVNRSQPTVGIRIKKLEESGILQYQAGLNLKNFNLYYAKVEIFTKNPNSLIRTINECPHMIHALKLSGLNNFLIIIGSPKLEDLDKIINFHFRNNPEIRHVSMEIILDIINEFLLPIYIKKTKCKCTA
ncbi:MAG: Lrp/AsnC family transcriptional regulator [Promethearchaeota archaeon]